MRRTPLLIAAVSLVAAATPAALLAHPSDGSNGKAPDVEHPVKAKGPKGTLHLFNACVTANAEAAEVELKVLSANHHARKALAGATAFTAVLDGDTKIRLVGKARIAPEGSAEKKLPKVGSYKNLTLGDVVTVRYRVARGTAIDQLGPAWKVTDRGPFAKKCPIPAGEDPKTEPPTTDPAQPSL
jgi:hypothetical protein